MRVNFVEVWRRLRQASPSLRRPMATVYELEPGSIRARQIFCHQRPDRNFHSGSHPPSGVMSPGCTFVSLWRTLSRTRAHYFVASGVVSFRVGARCVTELMAKFSCKMSVVAKAAGVGNLAERLARIERRPAKQKVRGMTQANGIHQFAARRAALRKKLLDVA